MPNCPDYVVEEAYSHECSSAGFWPGSDGQNPAFYSYAYPEPPGFRESPVLPDAAFYSRSLREFILPYAVVRESPDPARTLLSFLHSTYLAAAEGAGWDREALERPISTGDESWDWSASIFEVSSESHPT